MKTDSLQALIDATPDGEVCRLAKKEYFLNERVVLRGRKGLTLDGNGAVLVTRYHSNKSYHHSVDALLLEACEDVTLCNLQFDTDVAPNFPATVEKIDRENTAIVIRAHTPVRGDDALNLHSTAGTVTAAEGKQLQLHYCKKQADGLLPAARCRPGDRIAFYHPETMQKEAVAEVLSFCGADLKFRSIHGVPQPGMIALNTAFLPSSRITECTVRRSRGKGILLQSGNAEIDHCSFTDLTHPAVRVAPAFIKWFEVGPCENLDLHDNRIKNCCIATPDAAAITVSTSHGANDSAVHGLHKSIRIRNNIFEQMQKCIFVSSADGVQIQNNTLPSPNGIETVSCTDLLIE